MNHTMNNSKLKISALCLGGLLLLSTGAMAQNKNVKKAPAAEAAKADKPEGKELFSGTVTCRLAGSRGNAPEAKLTSAGTAAKSKEAPMREIAFSYGPKADLFSCGKNVTGRLTDGGATLVLTASWGGKAMQSTSPLCDMGNDRMCELSNLFRDAGKEADPEAVRQLMHKYYTPTDEMREIAGVKCRMYEMRLQEMTFPLWVDESRTTDGLMWPYIGLTHPVLGGVFFLPVSDMKMTATEFEAVSVTDKGAKDLLPQDKVKEISYKEMDELIVKHLLEESR